MKSQAEKQYRLFIAAVLIAVIITIGLLSVGWYFVLDIAKETSKLTTGVANAKKENSSLSDLMIRYRKVQNEKPVLLQAVPDSKDISGFILSIGDLATKYGLIITTSSIGEAKQTAKPSDLSQTLAKSGYNELQIKYTITGTYANLRSFLVDLQVIRRVNSVTNLRIVSDTANIKEFPDAVKADFVVSIYVKK